MRAAFVVFDRMTSLDFVGFYDPVTRLKSMSIREDFEWRICATRAAVVDDRGLRLEADAVREPLDDYDVIFVPGGFGTRDLQRDRGFMEWLEGAAPVPLKVSVCTGALLLGAAGFLRGRRATTHPTAYGDLAPYCGAVVRERVVDEGDVVTARGVSAAIDVGLHVVRRLAGDGARDRIAAQMDYPYRWDPRQGARARRRAAAGERMDEAGSRRFAREWIATWNGHDLDRILAHYSDDVAVTSPFVERVLGPGRGTLRGKPAVRAYWRAALEKYADLEFELIDAYAGVDSVVLQYRSVAGSIAAEFMRFDARGKVCEVRAHYVAEPRSGRPPR